jgi:predicted O-methyltransferase YrrM
MYSKVQLLKKYVQYWWNGSDSKGHGVHSPFVFNFIKNLLNDKRNYYCYQNIERLRVHLKKDTTLLTIRDFGAGSRVNSNYQRSVSSIAHSALKPKKYSQLLFRIAQDVKAKTILELGTSLGITTAYLASADPAAKVITMEGAESVAEVAAANFERLGLNNIEIVKGDFTETLPSVLQNFETLDLVFVDGNHRKEPTINYFEQLLPKMKEDSIIVFDDVHWSEEMETAWEHIKAHPSVTLSIDLFFIGVIFFRKEQLHKQHFSIRF